MPLRKRPKLPIAVLDLETDPFAYGNMVRPFVAGFYDGQTFSSWWSDDCVERLVTYLATQPPMTIYAHNGGKFDFFYFLNHLGSSLRIVNGRIIQATIGHHEIRDSFAIMPFALETYKKTPIDYQKFARQEREKHREEIVSYLRDDCIDLHTLCVAFRDEFGDVMTVGSASMQQLKKFHKFQSGNVDYDRKFREHYYFGGRNQAFKHGVFPGKWKVYDVNSMYPDVMRRYLHPIDTDVFVSNRIEKDTTFVRVEGHNYGAFPVRTENGSLDFTVPYGTFHTTIHEWNAALDTGMFKPVKIHKTYSHAQRATFEEFVNHFYSARISAKASGDKIRTIFYKFILNSGYGKFAQNPENYSDWFLAPIGEKPDDWHDCETECETDCRKVWSPAFISQNDYIIWSRPITEHHYYNIATGASITGAARSVLMRGIAAATDPLYCDTDSIIAKDIRGIAESDNELGAWKLEGTGDLAAIAGKKLYAIFNGSECIKKAHKGARLTGEEIIRIAEGETIDSLNPVPAFKFDGTWTFTKRRIRRTGTR